MTAFQRYGAVALLALGVGACDMTSADPDVASFDARAAVDDYASVEHILQTADWQGLGVLAQGAASVAPSGSGSRPAGAPLISGLHRGATFVYDATVEDYVVDPDRTGAPANGVRFVLYETVAGEPDPSRERGWADLLDEGDDSAEDIALRLRVTEGGVLTMDYAARLDENAGLGKVRVDGFVTGDGQRLEFLVEAEGREGGPLDLDFDLAVPGRSFSVVGEISGAEDSDDGQVSLEARHRDHSLGLDMMADAGRLDGDIKLDEALFAQVSGTSSDPVFTRANGDPLLPVEVLALHRIVDFVEDVFDLVEDVVEPLDELVLLGWIL